MVNQATQQIILKAREDFAGRFAPCALKILTKSGQLQDFSMNEIQLYTHEKLEEQLREFGRVRAIVLKARQTGISTYVEGRFYWRTSQRRGVRAHILTHEDKATTAIFSMVQRYHRYCHPALKPATGRANARELFFEELDSGYGVSTAQSKGTGRSHTIQYFHWSEVAHSRGAIEHMAGLGQTVPEMEGTEVIYESTANGKGNVFHDLWQSSIKGPLEDCDHTEADLIGIFVPWFWMADYRRAPPYGFALTDEEELYAKAYDLDEHQMAWRRYKIESDFQGQVWVFKQEYPATPAEAFQSPTDDPFISPDQVSFNRITTVNNPYGPILLGVDPAWYGADRTSMVWRKGRKVIHKLVFSKKNTMEVAGIVGRILEGKYEGAPIPDFTFVDLVGIGAGVFDRLQEHQFHKKVIGVNAGSKAIEENRFFNKRAEMWGLMKEWTVAEPCDMPEDDESLASDLCSPSYNYDSNYRLRIESKENMRKRGIRSPDDGDALALTFAEEVRERVTPLNPRRKHSWRTM